MYNKSDNFSGRSVSLNLRRLSLIIVMILIYNIYAVEADDAEVIPSTYEVLVRRLGASGIPASLLPVPQRRSHGAPSQSIFSNSMSAYYLAWTSDGGVKIVPRYIQP